MYISGTYCLFRNLSSPRFSLILSQPSTLKQIFLPHPQLFSLWTVADGRVACIETVKAGNLGGQVAVLCLNLLQLFLRVGAAAACTPLTDRL